MAAYQANGARLGWLPFPELQAVELWRAPAGPASAAPPERLESATLLEDGERLPGRRLASAQAAAGAISSRPGKAWR